MPALLWVLRILSISSFSNTAVRYSPWCVLSYSVPPGLIRKIIKWESSGKGLDRNQGISNYLAMEGFGNKLFYGENVDIIHLWDKASNLFEWHWRRWFVSLNYVGKTVGEIAGKTKIWRGLPSPWSWCHEPSRGSGSSLVPMLIMSATNSEDDC